MQQKIQNTFLVSLIMLFSVLVTGCKKENVEPISSLKGKCLQGRIITSERCTSAFYVQLLNAETGTTSTYNGKEYKNVISLGNIPKSMDLGADYNKTFYFTIDNTTDFENCTEFSPCTQEYLPKVTPVRIRVCGKNFSTSGCPKAE